MTSVVINFLIIWAILFGHGLLCNKSIFSSLFWPLASLKSIFMEFLRDFKQGMK